MGSVKLGPPLARFHHRLAWFHWAFAAVWLGMLGAWTALALVEGLPAPPEGWPRWTMTAALVFFWVGGAGLAAWAASRVATTVEVFADGTVVATSRSVLRTRSRRFTPGATGPARLLEDRDGDDDPYWRARVAPPGTAPFDLAEGHDRARMAAACDRFNAAIASAPRALTP